MLQQEQPDDYVIATGVAHTVEEFVVTALLCADLEPSIERYVEFDKKMIRPSEVDLLIGDASKAQRQLDWSPKVNFQDLVKLMVENDLRLESTN
jgi:GDPmannose 4,6-dehydratase